MRLLSNRGAETSQVSLAGALDRDHVFDLLVLVKVLSSFLNHPVSPSCCCWLADPAQQASFASFSGARLAFFDSSTFFERLRAPWS